MKILRACTLVVCVFAPFLVVGYALARVPNPVQMLQEFDGIDWMWLIFLGLMMVGLYHFLAVYLGEEDDIDSDFRQLDADHDGFITPNDAARWNVLARAFESFDSDHDGKLSRVEFENFEHSLAR